MPEPCHACGVLLESAYSPTGSFRRIMGSRFRTVEVASGEPHRCPIEIPDWIACGACERSVIVYRATGRRLNASDGEPHVCGATTKPAEWETYGANERGLLR